MTDINASMLAIGRDRAIDDGLDLPAVQCDAERLPFPDGSFDRVTVAFGLRNMTHKDLALAEMYRVLKPGGMALVLEFSQGLEAAVGALQRLLLRRAAGAGQAGRPRRAQLPIPGRIDPRPSRPAGAVRHDGGAPASPACATSTSPPGSLPCTRA